MQCCNPQYRQPWWVLQQLLLQHTRCCQKYLLPRTQSVAIGALAMILGVAIDLIATHQQHCNRWTLHCHAISVVAIAGTVYCHDKYLVARGSLSIATLNIVVAIGASVYCHGKCLVARGCLSIATINTGCYCWTLYCHANYCVATVGDSIATPTILLV